MKFINLLKKELLELLNKQMILGLAVTLVILMLVGNIMKTTIDEAVNTTYTINLLDNDNTETTAELIDRIEKSGAKIKFMTDNTGEEVKGDAYSKILGDNGVENFVIIPKGFTEAYENGEKPQINSISRMKSASTMSNISNTNSSAIAIIEACITEMLAEKNGITGEQLEFINAPIQVNENTVVDNNSAPVSSDSVMNKLMMQSMILPIVVFVLIMMTSQMLISAIANEKIDKTLETLLSAPVSRTAVIGAKMLSAAIVALINAVVYMLGFSKFVTGATDSISSEMENSAVTSILSVEDAMSQLGLSLGIGDYVLIGLQLFLTIMICLSISLILGAMVNDTKSSQSVIMPILMFAMVPYIISMITDVNALPMVFRIIVYAIPFTHTFSAMSNLMFGNTTLFFGGLIYQTVVFALCMFFALRLFKSDKIFTISLNFGQKSKYKKGSKKNSSAGE